MVITMVFCHNCGKQNEDSSNFCIDCGTKLIKDSIECSKCGEINEPNSNFCVKCGNNLKNKQSHKKSKITNTSIKRVKKPSKSSDKYYTDQFYEYYFDRDYDKAIEIVKEHIAFCVEQTGEVPEEIEKRLEDTIYSRNIQIYADNNIKGKELEAIGKIDEAQKLYEENVRLNADTPFTYNRLAAIYHGKKEFEKERDILKLYLEKLNNDERVDDSYKKSYIEELANVEQFLNTGRWKYDCLPGDNRDIYYEIKEAKTLLKSEYDGDKEKGIEMLENIMENGTYNNTVYNTLYQTYNKDKRFDDSIRVCKKAIEVLGFFSNDRKDRWENNLDKAMKRKEKSKK